MSEERKFDVLKYFLKQKKDLFYLLISTLFFLVLISNIKNNLVSSLSSAISISFLVLVISDLVFIFDNFRSFSKLDGEYQSFKYLKNKNSSQTDNIELNRKAFYTKVRYLRENILHIEHNYLNNQGLREKWEGKIIMQSKFHGLLPWEKVLSNGEPITNDKNVVGVKQVYPIYVNGKILLNLVEIQKSNSIGKELFKKIKW